MGSTAAGVDSLLCHVSNPHLPVLQRCQLGSSSAAVRCLSDLQQLSLNERSQMSGAFPLVCSSTVSSDQCSEAAALAASMWPNISVSQNTLAGNIKNLCVSVCVVSGLPSLSRYGCLAALAWH